MTQGMFRNSFLRVLIMVVLVVTCQRFYGQVVTGTLLGTVTDSTGAVVAGGKVIAKATSTGITHQTTTNGSGNYTFPSGPIDGTI